MDDKMITRLRNKCVPSTWIKRDLHVYKEKAEELKSILTAVVFNRGSNSVLISGPRNSGKTTLVESVIADLSTNMEFATSSHVIRLSGILCTDFMSSLEELSYELKVSVEFTNYVESQSFVEGRTEILTFLKEAIVASSKAIIIILDQIELFCQHRGQALLYNLFDIARSDEKPICVIGMTACQEILELFEKRVKSRFSHRIIFIKPLKFEEYQDYALSVLQMEKSDKWNKDMKELVNSCPVVQVLRQLFNSDNSIGALYGFLFNITLHCVHDSDLTASLISDLYERNIQTYGVKQQCMDLNLKEILIVLGILKAVKSGLPTFRFETLYEIIQKAAEAKGMHECDLRFSMKKLEELRIITAVDKNGLYYKLEMDVQDLHEVSQEVKIPTEFHGIL